MNKSILKPLKTALIVLAKRPTLGQGKQRLAEQTGSKTALKIAEVLLKLTIDTVSKWDEALVISPSSQEDSEWACDLVEQPVIVIPQKQGSLGQRLEQIDNEVRMLGFTHLIYIGTDAPLLGINDLIEIKKNLERYDQVFLPANDGGVIVMASRVPWGSLEDIQWSTEKVFSQLKSLSIQQGLCFQILPEQTDLDDLKSFNLLTPKLTKRRENPLIQNLLNFIDTLPMDDE